MRWTPMPEYHVGGIARLSSQFLAVLTCSPSITKLEHSMFATNNPSEYYEDAKKKVGLSRGATTVFGLALNSLLVYSMGFRMWIGHAI